MALSMVSASVLWLRLWLRLWLAGPAHMAFPNRGILLACNTTLESDCIKKKIDGPPIPPIQSWHWPQTITIKLQPYGLLCTSRLKCQRRAFLDLLHPTVPHSPSYSPSIVRLQHGDIHHETPDIWACEPQSAAGCLSPTELLGTCGKGEEVESK